MIIKILATHNGNQVGFINADTDSQEDGRLALEFCMLHLDRGHLLVALDEASDIERINLNLYRLKPPGPFSDPQQGGRSPEAAPPHLAGDI